VTLGQKTQHGPSGRQCKKHATQPAGKRRHRPGANDCNPPCSRKLFKRISAHHRRQYTPHTMISKVQVKPEFVNMTKADRVSAMRPSMNAYKREFAQPNPPSGKLARPSVPRRAGIRPRGVCQSSSTENGHTSAQPLRNCTGRGQPGSQAHLVYILAGYLSTSSPEPLPLSAHTVTKAMHGRNGAPTSRSCRTAKSLR